MGGFSFCFGTSPVRSRLVLISKIPAKQPEACPASFYHSASWPDLQSASPPAGPASNYKQEGELPCRRRRALLSRTARWSRSAVLQTKYTGGWNASRAPHSYRPRSRSAAVPTNKIHRGAGGATLSRTLSSRREPPARAEALVSLQTNR